MSRGDLVKGLGRYLKLVGGFGFVFVFILGSLFPVVALNSPSNFQEGTHETSSEVNALIVLSSPDSWSMRQTINLIENMGGRVVYIYPTHVLIGQIPEDLDNSVSELDGVIGLYRESVDLSVVGGYGDLALGGVRAWNNKLEGKPSPLDLRPEPISLLDNSTDNSATQGTVTAVDNSPGTLEYTPPYLWNSSGQNVTGAAGADSYSSPYNGGAWGTAWAWTGVGMGYGSHAIRFTSWGDGEVTVEVELIYAGGTSTIGAAMAGIGYYSRINGEQYQEVALDLSWPGFPTDMINLLESLVEFIWDSWELREALQEYVENGDAISITWRRTFSVTAGETYDFEAGMFAKATGAFLGYSEAAMIGQEWRIRVTGPVFLPKAEFSLATLYEVGLDFDDYLENGSKLVVKFYTYADTYQDENVVWSGTTPDHVSFSKTVPRPQGLTVEKARLDLTTDNTENVISTIATFTVTRNVLFGRLTAIYLEWPFADLPRRNALAAEIAAIYLQWPFAPTSSGAGANAGTGLDKQWPLAPTNSGTGPAVIYHPGSSTIEVESGQTFVLRHRLRWGEPDSGFYRIGIYWDSPENNPAENFTFLYASAYFDDDGDNLPDPGVAMIENRVEFAEGPPADDPTRTRYCVTVYSLEDNRNGTFNVDIWLRAAGWGADHSPTENHPIYYSGTIDVWEATTLSVSASPITIRVPARGVDVSISPSYQSDFPGATLNYAVTITNTGEVVDSYNLSVSDNFGWALTLSENRLENVLPGENRSVTLSVTIPDNAPGATDNITVTATSAANPEVRASDTCAARAIEIKTAKFYPSDDSYVEDWDYSNHGSEEDLWIAAIEYEQRRTWLKFDISSLPQGATITDGKLWLYFHDVGYFGGAPGGIGAHFSEDDNWSESTLNWGNEPSFNPTPTDSVPEFSDVDVWKSWALTSDVQSQFAGDKIISWSLKPQGEGFDQSNVALSKEFTYAPLQPYLEVTYYLA